VRGTSELARECIGERWLLFVGDDAAAGMYNVMLQRLDGNHTKQQTTTTTMMMWFVNVCF
jgi:hypothetical protein